MKDPLVSLLSNTELPFSFRKYEDGGLDLISYPGNEFANNKDTKYIQIA